MSSSKMTLMGLYQWNNELFKNLELPDDLDAGILIDNILVRSGEFEVLYADFEFNQYMSGAWRRKWADTFQRWERCARRKQPSWRQTQRRQRT